MTDPGRLQPRTYRKLMTAKHVTLDACSDYVCDDAGLSKNMFVPL